MSYKRVVEKGGKVYGPYIYESYRDKDGKVKKRYLGKVKEKSKLPLSMFFISVLSFLFLLGISYSTNFSINENETPWSFSKIYGGITGFVTDEIPKDVEEPQVDNSVETGGDNSNEAEIPKEDIKSDVPKDDNKNKEEDKSISEGEAKSESNADEEKKKLENEKKEEPVDEKNVSAEDNIEEDVIIQNESNAEPNKDDEISTNETMDETANETNVPINEVVNETILNETFTNETVNETEIPINEVTNETVLNEPTEDEISGGGIINGTVLNQTLENKTLANITLINETVLNETLTNATVLNQTLNETVNQTLLNETILNQTLINQTLQNITIFNVSDGNVTTLQYKAVIGRPVKWIKTVNISEGNVTIELPKEAKNISILTDDEAKAVLSELEDYDNIVNNSDREEIVSGGLLTGNVALDIKDSEGILTKFWNWLTGFTISGNVVKVNNGSKGITITDNTTKIVINNIVSNVTEVAIEYYTEAPVANEENLTNGKRVTVSAPSELNYTDILSYAIIEDKIKMNDSRLRLIWYEGVENNGTESVLDGVEASFTPYDFNNDGYVDYIEWIVPHLSNQTYDIIYITKAEHLDSNRSFVSDIYGYVNKKDNNWSEVINNGEFVRVTFEVPLDNSKDITLYARSVNGSAQVDVFEINGTEIIATFDNVDLEGWYKIYLINLNGSQNVFDLRVNGSVEFDYIVDPITAINFVSPTPADATITTNTSIEINLSITESNMNEIKYNWNGTNYSIFNNSLVLMMNFDNVSALGENDTYVVDVSGNGNNGTVVGGSVTTASGKYRRAMQFDGVNDYVDAGNDSSLNLKNEFAISAWVKATNTSFSATKRTTSASSKYSPQFQVVGGKIYYTWYEFDGSNDQTWTAEMNIDGTGWSATKRTTSAYWTIASRLQVVGGKIYYIWHESDSSSYQIWTVTDGANAINKDDAYGIGFRDGNVSGFLGGLNFMKYGANASNYTDGARVEKTIDTGWNYLVASYNQTELTLYVNGEKAGNSSYNRNITINPHDLIIGDNFNGSIDEVRIYNRSLSASEIQQLYFTNLNKYDTDKWSLYVNQSKNSTTGLDAGTYTYFSSAKDTSGNENLTETRSITINDEISPTYSNAGTNTTWAGESINFSIQYNDATLNPNGQYIFSTNNTGVWVNDSTINFIATLQTIYNITTLNSTIGISIGYRWYANDSDGNVNNTEVFTLTTTDGAPPNINFTSPTPVNNTITSSASVEINVSITNASDLNKVKYNWNGTNYSIYNNSLMLMMNFDNISVLGENDTLVVDISGNGNNGNVVGGNVTTTNGKYQGAMQFDGVNDYVNVPTLTWTPTAFSVEWWIYPLSVTNYNQQIIATNLWGSFVAHTTVNGEIYVGTDVSTRFTPTELPAGTMGLNKWQHFTFTFDNGAGKFYKDGNLLASKTGMANPVAWGGFQIGTGDLNTIDGSIDEVRIYNRSLSASEIQQLYFTNLNKYDTDKWSLYVNQSKNSTDGLDNGAYTYQAFAIDTSGNLNQTEIRTFTVDSTSPTYSNAGTNTTGVGTSANFSVQYNDNSALNPNGQYIFSTNNSGAWVNDSVINFTATPEWANVIKTLNSTVGINIGYRWYVNDSAGNVNNTGIFTLTTTEITPPQINFVSPTPVDATITTNTSVEINISITESNMNEVKFNWNGTNYSMYNDSLIFMMNFDNVSALGENDTYVVDVSGNGNNGNVIGGNITTANGKYQRAMQFDGSNDYVNITIPASFYGDNINSLTISMWVNPSSADGSIGPFGTCCTNRLYIEKDTAASSTNWIIGIQGSANRDTGQSFDNDKWQHLVLLMDNGTASLYKNGIAPSLTTSYTNYTPGNIPLIGRVNGDYFHAGSIDEVRIYNRSLSATEIQQLYFTNLNKYDTDKWSLYVNQSKNSTAGLDEGAYTYFSSAKDNAGNVNQTEIRTFTVDSTSPTYSNAGTNTTEFGTSINFSIQYNDAALNPNGQYIFSTNNTGIWVNDSTINFTATPQTIYNITTLNSTAGLSIGYRWYANDSVGNVNNTEIFTLTTTNYFKSTWNTSKTGTSNSTSISLPLESTGTYNFNVDWGDGNSDLITTYNQAEVTHDYGVGNAGVYNVNINGTIIGFRFNNGGDKSKLSDISNWGPLNLGNNNAYFYGADNLQITATDQPNLTGTTDVRRMFQGATSFNGNMSNWDVSGVTNTGRMFQGATSFNGSINNWNTSSVTIMTDMFNGATSFNQDIGNWDVSGVTNMYWMFRNAINFNQNLSNWDVSGVTDMKVMFSGATNFNGNISNWDVSSVTNMYFMFDIAIKFNSNISNWNTSSVTSMEGAFNGATNFNQDIGNWDVSGVTIMNWMFENATNFNQNLSNWDVSGVTTMQNMFYGTSFNGNISNWNVSGVTTMQNMFYGATNFNQNLSNWDVSGVTNMTDMFNSVTLSTANYDSLLNGWASLSSLQLSVPFDGGNSKYSMAANNSRNGTLIGTYSWTITDGGLNTPPTITIASPTNTTYTTTSINLDVSADEIVDTWWYSLNGGTTNTTFTPNTIITASEGINTINVWANDSVNNIGTSSVVFTVDTTSPTITIDSPTNTTYTTTSINLDVSASEVISTWWYSLNGGTTNTTFTPNTTITANQGINTVNLWANDSVNYIGTSSVVFSVDSINPNINFTSPTPANATTQSETYVYVNVTTNDTNEHSAWIDWNRSLVGYWSMDSYNSTGIYDNSSYGNFGSFTNGLGTNNITTGKRGKGLEFDGVNDYLKVLNTNNEVIPSNNNSFSISLWLKSDNVTTSTTKSIMVNENYAVDGFRYGTSSSAKLDFWSTESGGTISLTSNSALSAGNWYHAVITYNSSAAKMYINGVEESTDSSGVIISNTKNILIGGGIGGKEYLNGSIDEVMIFNRALSPQEINASFQAGSYRLFNNFTGLSDATYNYTAYVIDAAGNTNQTEERFVTVINNTAPNNATPSLVSIDGTNKTLANLNCSATISDPEGDNLNVSVKWYNNSIETLNIDYNNSYANGTTFSAILNSGNTTKTNNWSCSLRVYDGALYSGWGNSSNLTILNSLPTISSLSPNNWNSTTDRSPLFSWTGNDDDGDTLTYIFNMSEYLFSGGASCNDDIFNSSVSAENYIPASDLLCLYDNGFYYNWSVLANDGDGNGTWSTIYHINITASVQINLNSTSMIFDSLAPSATNDTTDNSPLPFVINNDGNALTNITINSSAIWNTQSGNSSYYQFKADNVTGEEGAFSWLLSIVNWFNMPITGNVIGVAELNYVTGGDSVEVDINLTVPENEGPGAKNATIIFTGSLAE